MWMFAVSKAARRRSPSLNNKAELWLWEVERLAVGWLMARYPDRSRPRSRCDRGLERAAAAAPTTLAHIICTRSTHHGQREREFGVGSPSGFQFPARPCNHNNEKQRWPFRRHSLISSSHSVIVAMCTILNYACAARNAVQRAALLLTIDFGQGGHDGRRRTTCASVFLCVRSPPRYWKFQSALIGSTFLSLDSGRWGRASFVCVNRIVRGGLPRASCRVLY